ncbi:MAG: hypothetical protein JWQ49_3628 [Edaphobacter sp.]|nr:hypothetical protein [Edaphobacter sp.]
MQSILWKALSAKKQTNKPGKMRLRLAVTKGLTTIGLGVLVCMGSSSVAFGEEARTPAEITPPRGNLLFLTTHATGTQNYICLPSTDGQGTSWVFFAPQATLSVPLFDHHDQQVLTHFLSPVPNANSSPEASCTLSSETGKVSCPTWQSSLDSSAVWGGKVGSIDAGLDASCPKAGAIPCLLLNAVATRRGQIDAGLMGKTTFIQRLNTSGGAAPAGSCKVGDQALVPYSADYSFYRAEHEDSGKSDR